jgi:hypothetical protein
MSINPGFAGVRFQDVRRVGARFAGAEYRLEDLPDGWPIAGFEFADRDQDSGEGELARRK